MEDVEKIPGCPFCGKKITIRAEDSYTGPKEKRKWIIECCLFVFGIRYGVAQFSTPEECQKAWEHRP